MGGGVGGGDMCRVTYRQELPARDRLEEGGKWQADIADLAGIELDEEPNDPVQQVVERQGRVLGVGGAEGQVQQTEVGYGVYGGV